MGSWAVFGLGSESESLPAYVVMPDPDGALEAGQPMYMNGFLPAAYQPTLFRPGPSPVRNLDLPEGVSLDRRRKTVELIRRLNEANLPAGDTELAARIANTTATIFIDYTRKARIDEEGTGVHDLRDRLNNTGLWAAQTSWSAEKQPLLGVVREAMRTEKTLNIAYANERGEESERPIWPITLAYYEEKQIIGAWCLLRQDFRNFRIDRVRDAKITEQPFGKRRVILMKEWEAIWQSRTRRDAASDSTEPASS
jgi:hypothetical protein